MTKSKFGVRKPATMKMKRKKRLQRDAILKWIRSEPIIMVPDRRSGPEEDSWKYDYEHQCYQKESGYITEGEPEQTHPPE
ncbi:hypothetical protein A2U01_0072003 [Trifolium medium]|uniref:Uncharacterized protein n=1 Tax=Trifolium medium TaxID=97028 RepID=A0A392SQ00_9FABA|nr:hypothetical protein [Trifolium medium]